MNPNTLVSSASPKDDNLAEWTRVICLLIGVGAIPLWAGLPWLSSRYWAVSLAAGIAALGLGIFYGVRPYIQGIIRKQAARRSGLPVRAHLDQRLVLVFSDPEAEAVARASGRLAVGAYPAVMLVCVGLFIILPAVSALLMQTEGLENVPLVSAYLGSPALAVWISFEGIRFWANWKQRDGSPANKLVLIRSGAQICAAGLVWNYLGLAYSLAWAVWIFWLGVLLALLGAAATEGGFLMGLMVQPTSPGEAEREAQEEAVSKAFDGEPNSETQQEGRN